MSPTTISPQVTAYLGRVELELAQVAGRMADQMELIDIYVPVRALTAANLEVHVIVDGLYPRRGAHLDFEVGPLSGVTSINGP